MKLDERFKVLPFCCFGADKKAITNHIGKKGYFANTIRSFNNIKLCKYGTLGTVLGDQQESFYMNETEETFSFFIPECFVKPKEKQYRPYKTVSEFFEKENLDMHSKIRMRRKDNPHNIQTVYIVGFGQTKIDNGYVEYLMLGCHEYSLEILFKNFEFQLAYTDEFKPFGIEE